MGKRGACIRTAEHRCAASTYKDDDKHAACTRMAGRSRSARTRTAAGKRAAHTLTEDDMHATRTRIAENQTCDTPVGLVVRPSGGPQKETVLGIRYPMVLLQRGIPHTVQVRELREGLRDQFPHETVCLGRCQSEAGQVSIPSVWVVRSPDTYRKR